MPLFSETAFMLFPMIREHGWRRVVRWSVYRSISQTGNRSSKPDL